MFFAPRTRHQDLRTGLRHLIERLEDRLVLSTLPTGFTEAVVASNLTSATTMQFSPDGKLFIAEQAGTMEVWQNGTRLQANFFANAPLGVLSNSERGLLGIAFDPSYASNRFVYVYYTPNTADGHNRVSRFTANATGDLATGSETILLELDPHSAGNHNGGALNFGADGKLYIATGDNAFGANAQSITNRHGKILRINADGTIPTDNPTSFAGIQGTLTGANRAIWAIGLRNPFTFAFQPGTGRMFINDVGEGTWEEINEGGFGRNFGWSSTEGNFNQQTFPNFTLPFYTYDHGNAEPNGLAITGGVFYNPTTNQFGSAYASDYFFADYGSGEIWRVDLSTKAVNEFASGISAPVDLKIDNAGNLYYLARGTGQVFRVSFSSQAPVITDEPDSQTKTVGTPVTFSVAASGTTPFTYQWQRAEAGTTNFVNIASATSSSYTINSVQTGDSGDRFRVIVRDALQRATTSNVATLTVTTNQPPSATPVISGGLRNGKWDAGALISFNGSGTDPEQGNLPASAFSWRVDYLTSINAGDNDADGLPGLTRPFLSPQDIGAVTSGSFRPANTGPYNDIDVAYVLTLTVTDNQGITDTERVIVSPNTVTLTIATNPSGLQVTTDGQPFTAPRVINSVVGFQRVIGTTTSQSLNGVSYSFTGWSHGGNASQTITTPTTNTTYTATFTQVAFNTRINFQDTTSAGFPGYLADTGLAFGSRGNGLSYGWNISNTANARNRNVASSADERYDTLNHLQKAGGSSLWEIAVPNGRYTVTIVAGDPAHTDQINHLNLEGTQLRDPDGFDNFDTYTATVTVADGRLSISPGTGANNAKLAFIDIAAAATDSTAPTITNRTPPAGATVNASGVNIDVSFSEAVTGVDATDLVLSGAGAANAVKAAPVNLGNNTWRFAVSGLTTGAVNVSLAPDANDIEDAAGNDLANLIWSYTANISTPPFALKVNFQTTNSGGFAGFVADTGLTFGNRGNGFSYGWNVSNTANARNRNVTNSPDERYDTFNHMQRGNNASWEVAVPNGTYQVRVVTGDPSYSDSVYRINVENTLAINGTPTTSTRWFDNTVTVLVTDGRLTVSNASGAQNNKISFIEILRV